MRMHAADALVFNQQFRWTRDRFEELAGLDVFQDVKLELVRGAIVRKPTMNPPHANAIEGLTEFLVPALVGKARVRIQLPLVIDDESELVPDLAIIDRRTTKKDHPFTALLVIEISDTTARYDRIVKAPLYAQAGVQEYWRFDMNKRHVEVFAEPKHGQWGRHQRVSRGELAVPGFPSVTVRLEDVFDA